MNKLLSGLETLEIEISQRQERMLNSYIKELEIWNKKLNLVSFRDYDELIIRHILDSLSALPEIKTLEGTSIADAGSGAGLPGMLLAIFLEDRSFTLIERSGKKAGFLKSTSALLGLVDRIEVFDHDLVELKESFDIVTLRAFREFGDYLPALKAITRAGGTIAAYKGKLSSINDDLGKAGLSVNDVKIAELEVPFLSEQRHLLLYKKKI